MSHGKWAIGIWVIEILLYEQERFRSACILSDLYCSHILNIPFLMVWPIFKGHGRQLCQNYFCVPYEKGSTLDGKNLLPEGANSFLSEQTLCAGSSCAKSKKLSQKLSPLKGQGGGGVGVSSTLKICLLIFKFRQLRIRSKVQCYFNNFFFFSFWQENHYHQ